MSSMMSWLQHAKKAKIASNFSCFFRPRVTQSSCRSNSRFGKPCPINLCAFYNYNTIMKEWKCLLMSINQIELLIIIIALLQYTADLFLVWAAVYMT